MISVALTFIIVVTIYFCVPTTPIYKSVPQQEVELTVHLLLYIKHTQYQNRDIETGI